MEGATLGGDIGADDRVGANGIKNVWGWKEAVGGVGTGVKAGAGAGLVRTEKRVGEANGKHTTTSAAPAAALAAAMVPAAAGGVQGASRTIVGPNGNAGGGESTAVLSNGSASAVTVEATVGTKPSQSNGKPMGSPSAKPAGGEAGAVGEERVGVTSLAAKRARSRPSGFEGPMCPSGDFFSKSQQSFPPPLPKPQPALGAKRPRSPPASRASEGPGKGKSVRATAISVCGVSSNSGVVNDHSGNNGIGHGPGGSEMAVAGGGGMARAGGAARSSGGHTTALGNGISGSGAAAATASGGEANGWVANGRRHASENGGGAIPSATSTTSSTTTATNVEAPAAAAAATATVTAVSADPHPSSTFSSSSHPPATVPLRLPVLGAADLESRPAPLSRIRGNGNAAVLSSVAEAGEGGGAGVGVDDVGDGPLLTGIRGDGFGKGKGPGPCQREGSGVGVGVGVGSARTATEAEKVALMDLKRRSTNVPLRLDPRERWVARPFFFFL